MEIGGGASTALDFVLESLVCVTGELVIWKNNLAGVNMAGMFPNLETVSGSLTVDLNTNIYELGPSAFSKLQHVQKRILVRVPVATVLLCCSPVHTPRCMRAVPVPCPARSASQQPYMGDVHGNARRERTQARYFGVPCLQANPFRSLAISTHVHTSFASASMPPCAIPSEGSVDQQSSSTPFHCRFRKRAPFSYSCERWCIRVYCSATGARV